MLRTSQKTYSKFDPDIDEAVRRCLIRTVKARVILRRRRIDKLSRHFNTFFLVLAFITVGFALGNLVLFCHLEFTHRPLTWPLLEYYCSEVIHQVRSFFNIP